MTSAGPALGESRSHRGLAPGEAEALIAEAGRRQRDRRRRTARLILGAGLVAAVAASIPEAIVVRNLATGMVRRWAFTSDVPDISSLSWSPDSRFLSYTSLSWASGRVGEPPPDGTTQLLDTRSGGTLTGGRRIPLAHGLAWAGFLTAQIGMAVAPYPAVQGRQQNLVAVAVATGRILGRLTPLPTQGLAVDNAADGTEGTSTADPTGHYILIAGAGPLGGQIFRWAAGMRQLASITSGAIRAAWA